MSNYFPIIIVFSLGFSQTEVNIRDLEKLKDIYYLKNATNPFEGVAISFSKLTGKKVLEFQIINGEKDGTYNEWYINGKKKSNYHYKNNVKHGRYTKY